jgi:hypothetical protein
MAVNRSCVQMCIASSRSWRGTSTLEYMQNYQSYQMEIGGFASESESGSPGFRNRAGRGRFCQGLPPPRPGANYVNDHRACLARLSQAHFLKAPAITIHARAINTPRQQVFLSILIANLFLIH